MVVLGKIVVFLQKLLFSGKSGCTRAKSWYLGKVVAFGQNLLYLGKKGTRANMVVFGQKWLLLGEVVVFRLKLLYSGAKNV